MISFNSTETFTFTKSALRSLVAFVSKDDARVALNQALFCPTTGQVWASHGYVGASWRADISAPATRPIDPDQTWLVPRAYLDRAIKLCPSMRGAASK